MENVNRHLHWENIYRTKKLTESGWYQPVPKTSLEFLEQAHLQPGAKIIDVGGGDSLFADYVLDLGYRDITVLDISATAIHRARERLGDRARLVKWIVEDITTFVPKEKYDFWHDRATFHFLTKEDEVEQYVQLARTSIQPQGFLILGTFSENGPEKCSGLDIRQYAEKTMTHLWQSSFKKIKCIRIDHTTPSEAIQNYLFCSFRKVKAP